jgi:hypothetical protein
VNDRGRTGGVTMSRSATAFSGFGEAPWTNPRSPFYAPCSSGDPYSVICPAQHDGKLTADGWTLDYETWQGVRTSDLSVGQWNTPDAHAGEVHDPISQKPFMWNRNNPYAYQDPTGYDVIEVVARDTGLASAHTYIRVRHHDGSVTRYSFSHNGIPNAGGQLRSQPNDYDKAYDKQNLGVMKLASCEGTCTLSKGGFDEAGLDKTAKEIDAEHFMYDVKTLNSNSATYTECVNNAADTSKCAQPNTNGWAAPGWGKNLLPPKQK